MKLKIDIWKEVLKLEVLNNSIDDFHISAEAWFRFKAKLKRYECENVRTDDCKVQSMSKSDKNGIHW